MCCSVKRDAMSADQPVVSYSAGKGRPSYVNCRLYAYTRASHPYRRPHSSGTIRGKGTLSDDDARPSVCLSVSLSVVNLAYMRLVQKLPNRSTWKFRTALGPWKSINGYSIITLSQIQLIQDGGRCKDASAPTIFWHVEAGQWLDRNKMHILVSWHLLSCLRAS